MSISLPSNLHLTQYGIYHFRITVPKDLRCLVGKGTIKQSLRTGVRSEAIIKSFALKYKVKRYFKGLRDNIGMPDTSFSTLNLRSPENRKLVLDNEYKHIIQLCILKDTALGSIPKAIINDADKFEEVVRDLYEIGDTQTLYANMVKKHNLMLAEGSTISKLMIIEIEDMVHRLINDVKKFLTHKLNLNVAVSCSKSSFKPPLLTSLKSKELAEFINNDTSLTQPPPAVLTPVTETKGNSIKLSELIKKYLLEKDRESAWTENTKKEYKSIFALSLEIFTDVTVDVIGHQQANSFKDTLLKLPKNKDKNPLYRSKTIAEILTLKPNDIMSVKTVNKKLGLISSLFLWAKRHGYVKDNYFEGLSLKDARKDSDKRKVFSTSDLQKLFSSPNYETPNRKNPYQYWTPLIALHTGARIEEICQLHTEDIRQEENVWVFDINKLKDKRVKNNASVRIIPIHPKLLELGFLEYVDSQKKKKASRVFPELKKQQDKYGHYASRWFSTYRKQCGIKESGKVFHSFRHTVINTFKQKGIKREEAEAITGHTDTSISYGLYGKDYAVSTLQKVIEELCFNDVLGAVHSWK